MFEVGDYVDGQLVCLKALVGSHNYNLNTPESDKDYKYFVYPTFDNLYDGEMFHKSVVSETEDYTVHDVRMLPSLLWKANLNFVELLYSQELEGLDGLDKYLVDNRRELSLMNMPRMFAAGRGTSLQKQRDMVRDSEGRHANMVKFGYDTKSACHAYRMLDFLTRLPKENGDVGNALWYSDEDPVREKLLSVKAGAFCLEDVQDMLDDMEKEVRNYEECYDKETNMDMYYAFEAFVKALVKKNLT